MKPNLAEIIETLTYIMGLHHNIMESYVTTLQDSGFTNCTVPCVSNYQ